MTSLNMNGFSLSVLELNTHNYQMTIDLLDQFTNAPAWPKTYARDLDSLVAIQPSPVVKHTLSIQVVPNNESFIEINDSSNANMFKMCVKTIAEDLKTAKGFLNQLDSVCGDGDCGNSLAKVSELILETSDQEFNFYYPHQVTQNSPI